MTSTVATHESGLVSGRAESLSEWTGCATEAVAGAAAIVLSILGLLHIEPTLMASIATIVVGASLLIAGGFLALRFARYAEKRAPHATPAVGGGMAMESLGGAVGVVLGILSLVGAGATTLLPVATIVFGGSLLVASGAAARFDAAYGAGAAAEWLDVAGPSMLIALGGIVLGIVGLAGVSPLILSLAAMLSYGFAVLLSDTAVISAMLMGFSA